MNHLTEACFATLRGDLTSAARIAEEAYVLGQRAGRPDAGAFHHGQLFVVRWHQGLLADQLPDLHAFAARFTTLPASHAMCALGEAVAGDRERAQQILCAAAEHGFTFPHTATWLSGMCLWADVAIELRDSGAAVDLYDQLRPWGRLFATLGPTPVHAISLSLAGLAALLDPPDRAHQHFSDALGIHQRMRMPFGITLTELHWGKLYLAQGNPTARQHLAHAVELAARYGYADIHRRAQHALASAPQSENLSSTE